MAASFTPSHSSFHTTPELSDKVHKTTEYIDIKALDPHANARKVVLTAEQTKIECDEDVSIPQDVKDIVNKLLESAEYDHHASDKDEPWSVFATKWGVSFASGVTKEAATENLRWQLQLEILSQRAVNRFDVF